MLNTFSVRKKIFLALGSALLIMFAVGLVYSISNGKLSSSAMGGNTGLYGTVSAPVKIDANNLKFVYAWATATGYYSTNLDTGVSVKPYEWYNANFSCGSLPPNKEIKITVSRMGEQVRGCEGSYQYNQGMCYGTVTALTRFMFSKTNVGNIDLTECTGLLRVRVYTKIGSNAPVICANCHVNVIVGGKDTDKCGWANFELPTGKGSRTYTITASHKDASLGFKNATGTALLTPITVKNIDLTLTK